MDNKLVAIGIKRFKALRPHIVECLRSTLSDYHRYEWTTREIDILLGDWINKYLNLYIIKCLQGSENAGYELEFLNNLSNEFLLFDDAKVSPVRSFQIDGSNLKPSFFQTVLLSQSSTWKQVVLNWAFSCLASPGSAFLLSEQALRLGRVERIKLAVRWRKWAIFDEMLLSKQLNVGVDFNWRLNQAQKYVNKCSSINRLNSILICLLPVYAVEGFNDLAKQLEKHRASRPKFVFTAIGLHNNFFLKVGIVTWSRLGTKLIGRQHGGGYGADFEHIFEMYEVNTSDFFFTWGWKTNNGKSSVLSPPVSAFRGNKNTNNILLNCVDYPSDPYRLHYQPIGKRVEFMRDETCRFLNYIEKYHRVLIRPYQKDYSGFFIQKLKIVSKNNLIQRQNVPSIKAYSQSKLVVHNYLGTAFLETLGLDIPTMCFYDKGAYRFRRNDLFEMLEEVGIIHQSSKSAADFLISLDGKIANWWASKKLIDVKKKFLAQYFDLSSDWVSNWENELVQLQLIFENE